MSNIAFLFLPLAFSSLPAVLPFVSPSSQVFCDGSALRPFGRWARAMGTGRFDRAPEELHTRGAKAISLCMIQPFIISVFQNLGSGCFFRSPAFCSESGGKFCRIEVRHLFPPKGGSRYGEATGSLWHRYSQSHESDLIYCMLRSSHVEHIYPTTPQKQMQRHSTP